jgi:phage tail sheath protein FI
MPPSGHVAGLISRSDRERGAYVTPANASLEDATDLSRRPGDAAQGELNRLGINALRCQSGRGIVVWGGRLPATERGTTGFVAHRRFVHRLVRAVRRVAAPLVFDPNDQQLALAISRAATTLLMEAFHSGILKGRAPAEAFQVSVGPDVNDFASREAGRLICDIAIAPAVPMEFIHIRVGLTTDGSIELVEA